MLPYRLPGDRLNITGVYTERQTVTEDDGMGGTTKTTVEVFKTTEVFTDIMIADLLNSSGDSILDIYASYNDKSVWQQAQLEYTDIPTIRYQGIY